MLHHLKKKLKKNLKTPTVVENPVGGCLKRLVKPPTGLIAAVGVSAKNKKFASDSTYLYLRYRYPPEWQYLS